MINVLLADDTGGVIGVITTSESSQIIELSEDVSEIIIWERE